MSDVFHPSILEQIVRFICNNDIACSLRLVNKATAAQFRNHCTVRLSLPVPCHAFTPISMWPLTFRLRLKLLCHTAGKGCTRSLHAALEASGLSLASEQSPRDGVHIFGMGELESFDLLSAAASARQLQVCDWLLQRGCPWGNALASAAGAGHRDVCEWLLDQGCPCDPVAICSAAHGNHMGLATWLAEVRPHQIQPPGADEILAAVAHGCDLATLQQAYSEGLPTPHDTDHPQPPQDPLHHTLTPSSFMKILAAAAGSPTEDWQAKCDFIDNLTANLLWAGGGDLSDSWHVCDAAARCPDATQRLQWLQQRDYLPHLSAVQEAAAAGNLPALVMMLCPLDDGDNGDVDGDNGVHDGQRAAAAAARGGHLAALQVLHARGWLQRSLQPLQAAAGAGHLPVLTWLVEALGANEMDDLMGYNVFFASVEGGHLQVAAWLEARVGFIARDEYGLADQAFRYGAMGGCAAMLEWLADAGCPMLGDGTSYIEAALNGDLATLAYLRRLDCPWGPPGFTFTTCVACSGRGAPLASLRWLLQAGCPVDVAEASRRATWRLDTADVMALLRESEQQPPA